MRIAGRAAVTVCGGTWPVDLDEVRPAVRRPEPVPGAVTGEDPVISAIVCGCLKLRESQHICCHSGSMPSGTQRVPPGSGSAIAGRSVLAQRRLEAEGGKAPDARVLRKPRHRCPRWCRRHLRGRRLRPRAGPGPARRLPRKPLPAGSEPMAPGPRYTSATVTNACSGNGVVQAVPATVQLLADLVPNLLDLLRLQHSSMTPGTGCPVDQACLVKIPPAGYETATPAWSIRLLGDRQCRTVKKRNMRGKHRHTKAAFPRLVSRIAISHSCPPALSTDQAGPLDCRRGPPGRAPPGPRSRPAVTYLLSGLRPCIHDTSRGGHR